MLHNATTGFNMLSTHVHIDQGEYSSITATTTYVIDPARKVVSEDDRVRVDIDAAGTGVKGLSMKLDFVEVDQ
jgi:hypothetical protein